MRAALAIIAGIVAGVLVILGAQWLGGIVFPPPEGADLSDPAQLADLVETLPIAALAAIVVAWVLGALVGGAVAGRLAGRAWQPASATVGGFLIFFGGIVLLQFAHPLWMWIAGVVLPIPTAWFGGHLTHNLVPEEDPAQRRRRARRAR